MPSRWCRPLVAALGFMAFLSAGEGVAQTAPVPETPVATPTSPDTAPAPESSDDFQWLSLGAIAECRDGMFFHGKPGARACSEHGGVRRWLRGNEQDLLR